MEIPKDFFGNDIGIVGDEESEPTIGKIEDKDCKGREVVTIDGRKYVVTDSNVILSAVLEKSYFVRLIADEGYTIGKYKLENCSVLKNFSDCQGETKGAFADDKYYRDAEGTIFPASFRYYEYKNLKDRQIKGTHDIPNRVENDGSGEGYGGGGGSGW